MARREIACIPIYERVSEHATPAYGRYQTFLFRRVGIEGRDRMARVTPQIMVYKPKVRPTRGSTIETSSADTLIRAPRVQRTPRINVSYLEALYDNE